MFTAKDFGFTAKRDFEAFLKQKKLVQFELAKQTRKFRDAEKDLVRVQKQLDLYAGDDPASKQDLAMMEKWVEFHAQKVDLIDQKIDFLEEVLAGLE